MLEVKYVIIICLLVFWMSWCSVGFILFFDGLILGILVFVELYSNRFMLVLLSCDMFGRLVGWLFGGNWLNLMLLVCRMVFVLVYIVMVNVFGVEWLMVKYLYLNMLCWVFWFLWILMNIGVMWYL